MVFFMNITWWKLVLWCKWNQDIIALWYMHNFCFAGAFKFKQDNTSKPGIYLHQIGGDCWTLALMSPNLCGWLEDFVTSCVCGFWVVWIFNPLIELIQGCLILIFLKKICFQREVENQPIVLLIQPIVLHLVVFEKDLKLSDFGWLCCQTNSIDCFLKILNWIFKFVKFVLIDSKLIWLLH